MIECDKCVVKACCRKLCIKRENELIKEYRKNGILYLDMTYLNKSIILDVITSITWISEKCRSYEVVKDNSKFLVLENTSELGEIKKGENNACKI